LAAFANVIGMQFVWIITLGTLLTLAYRRGITQLTINGG